MATERKDMKPELLELVREVEPDWQPDGEDRSREEVEAKQAAFYEVLAKLQARHGAGMQAKETTAGSLRGQISNLSGQVEQLKNRRLPEMETLVKTLEHLHELIFGTSFTSKGVRHQAERPSTEPYIELEYIGPTDKAVTLGLELSSNVTMDPADGRKPRTFKLDDDGVEEEVAFAVFVGAPLSRLVRSGDLVPKAAEPPKQQATAPAPQGVTLQDVERVLAWLRTQEVDIAPDRLLAALARGVKAGGNS